MGTRSFWSGLVACMHVEKNSISPGTRSMLHALHSTKSSNSKNAITVSVIFRLRAKGRNNSQHCCDNNVRSCCSVLAVVYKRMQQLPTMLRQQCWELLRACWQWCANRCNNSQSCWDIQCIVGRIQPISLCKPCVMNKEEEVLVKKF